MDQSVIDVTAAVICRDGRVLIAQRGPVSHLAGHWEFPGGKRELNDADLASCLRRELQEELKIGVAVGKPLGVVTCELESGLTIRLHPFWCELIEGEPTPRVHTAVRWVSRDELTRYRFPLADIPVVERLFREGIPAAR